MPWSDDKRETGSALMIIGWILVLFALLAMFFQPAAFKLGESRIEIIAGILIAAGLALNIIGARLRSRNT